MNLIENSLNDDRFRIQNEKKKLYFSRSAWHSDSIFIFPSNFFLSSGNPWAMRRVRAKNAKVCQWAAINTCQREKVGQKTKFNADPDRIWIFCSRNDSGDVKRWPDMHLWEITLDVTVSLIDNERVLRACNSVDDRKHWNSIKNMAATAGPVNTNSTDNNECVLMRYFCNVNKSPITLRKNEFKHGHSVELMSVRLACVQEQKLNANFTSKS